jgi:hypothetical protein
VVMEVTVVMVERGVMVEEKSEEKQVVDLAAGMVPNQRDNFQQLRLNL